MTVDDHPRTDTQRRMIVLLATVGTLMYAALASTTRVNTTEANLAVLVPGVAVAAVAMNRPRDLLTFKHQPLQRTAGLWAALLVFGLVWEGWAWAGERQVGPDQHPTLSALLDPYLNTPSSRFAAWGIWLVAGWRLIRR